MTSHPQPEYIITEEDIHCLFDYFQAALDGEENKETLKRLFDQQCGVMRSNIYNPQAERDCPTCGGKLMCHRWCIDSDCGWDSIKELRQEGKQENP